jgi:hypothetical protein
MKALWVVQSNLLNEDSSAAIQAACIKHGRSFQGIVVIPFTGPEGLLVINHDGPIIAYGSTRFIKNVVDSGRWSPGAFFDENIFTVKNYLDHWGPYMVNHDASILPLGVVSTKLFSYRQNDKVFVRPNGDMKQFDGMLMTVNSLCKWSEEICKGGYEFDGSLLIAVSLPKVIEQEWRLFIVDGKVVTGSLYRVDGQLRKSPYVPPQVITFAEERIREWNPTLVLVLDIGAMEDGELKIIEMGDFHSAGHYCADIEKIVVAVSEVAEENYRSVNTTVSV